MVMPNVLSNLEKTLGLPRLSQVADSLQGFPDAKQLKLIKEVMVVAERVSQSTPELDKIAMLIREINSMPLDKLEKVEKILKRVEKIMKTAPAELLDLLGSLKGD